MTPEDFVRAHTELAPVAGVPAAPGFAPLRLHLATELTPLWHATEPFLKDHQMEPPYWAFAWPGSLALAAWMSHRPEVVAGRVVWDFAAGSGLAAIVALQRGARRAVGLEVDPLSGVAMALNAAVNGVSLEIRVEDAARGPVPEGVDLLVAGDVCYSEPMVAHILPWFRRCAAAGVRVVIADPGRLYVPAEGVREVGVYEIPTLRELEDRDSKHTRLVELVAA